MKALHLFMNISVQLTSEFDNNFPVVNLIVAP